jgi:metal transporter CNNM
MSSLPTEEYVIFSCVSLGLVLFGGLMSGLTVGLLSIDDLVLEMKMADGTDQEKKAAKSVYSVVTNHHLLMVTLLIANASAMEALPLFLDEMVPPWAAIILSMTLVLFFGEIIPQAMFTGPEQMKIANRMVPFVKVIIVILYPLAWPIAKVLDR